MSLFGGGNTHVSNVLTMSVVSMSLSFGVRSVGNLSLDMAAVLRGELFRVIASHLYFKSWPQLIVGMVVMRSLSSFEQLMGSRKFGNFMVVGWGMCTLAQIGLATTLSSVGLHVVPEPGPFFYIYSLLPFYYNHVPKTSPTQYKMFGFSLSEKTWVYALCAQLLLSDGLSSVISGLSGLLAGYLYMTDDLKLQQFRLPAAVERACGVVGTLLDSLFSSPAPINRRPRAPQNPNRGPLIGPSVGQQRGFGALDDDNRVPLVQPTDANIEKLLGLGFDREVCVNALRATNNNVEAAADRLFSGVQ